VSLLQQKQYHCDDTAIDDDVFTTKITATSSSSLSSEVHKVGFA
jgi:hypothetical protein